MEGRSEIKPIRFSFRETTFVLPPSGHCRHASIALPRSDWCARASWTNGPRVFNHGWKAPPWWNRATEDLW